MPSLMHKIKNFTNHHPEWAAFFLLSCLILYLNLRDGEFTLYYDAQGYWSFSRSLVRGETFSFLHYNWPLRGYLFPFLILVVTHIADLADISSYIGYEVAASLAYSATLTIVIPEIVRLLWGRRPALLPILVFSSLALYFWRGLFYYPLTDLPAFFFVLIGVYIILKFPNYWWLVLVTGMLWGGSVLLRPSYQISLFPLLIWGIYRFYRDKVSKQLWPVILRTAVLAAGLLLVVSPQIAINWQNHGIIYPFVPTQFSQLGGNLFALQLGWGIEMQKYETNIGESYPSPRVVFLDRHGESILLRSGYKRTPYAESSQIGPDVTLTLVQYLKLVAKFPLDFMVLYARHFFNGLDIVYNTVYIKDVFARAFLFRWINYTIWFLVLIYIAHHTSTRKMKWLDDRLFLILCLALPALLSIPTAIEVRFMVPLQFMAYALVAFWVLPDFLTLEADRKKTLILQNIFWYGCFLLLCFMLSANTYMGLSHSNYILAN